MSPQQTALILESYLKGLHAMLSPLGQATLASIGGSIASNPQAAIRALWNLALTEIKDPQMQRIALNMARPALGAVGVGWANIQMSCVALTGMTVGAVVMEVMFWIAVAVLVVLLFLLLLWMLSKLVEFLAAAFTWNPGANKPRPPLRQPDWNRLLNVLHDSSVGPLYAIESRAKPTAIQA